MNSHKVHLWVSDEVEVLAIGDEPSVAVVEASEGVTFEEGASEAGESEAVEAHVRAGVEGGVTMEGDSGAVVFIGAVMEFEVAETTWVGEAAAAEL